jgi:CRP-like cAMP-binding protein
VHLREYKAGETVIRRGVAQSGFYMIRSGSVHIVRRGLDGTGKVVGTLYPPELLGEFALLDDSPRSSTIVAAEPSELIGFFKPDLMDILITKPALGCKILLRLSEKMAHTLRVDYARLLALGFPLPESAGSVAEMDPTAS